MVRIDSVEGRRENQLESVPAVDSGNTEHLWHIYSTINEWIRAADIKAGLILTASGVIATVIAALEPTALSRCLDLTIPNVLLWLGMAAVILSVFFSASCIAPRVRPLAPDSLIFFGDIARAHCTPAEYADAWQGYTPNQRLLGEDLCSQIWANSHVAQCKFAAVNRATTAFAFAVFLLLFSSLLSLGLGNP